MQGAVAMASDPDHEENVVVGGWAFLKIKFRPQLLRPAIFFELSHFRLDRFLPAGAAASV